MLRRLLRKLECLGRRLGGLPRQAFGPIRGPSRLCRGRPRLRGGGARPLRLVRRHSRLPSRLIRGNPGRVRVRTRLLRRGRRLTRLRQSTIALRPDLCQLAGPRRRVPRRLGRLPRQAGIAGIQPRRRGGPLRPRRRLRRQRRGRRRLPRRIRRHACRPHRRVRRRHGLPRRLRRALRRIRRPAGRRRRLRRVTVRGLRLPARRLRRGLRLGGGVSRPCRRLLRGQRLLRGRLARLPRLLDQTADRRQLLVPRPGHELARHQELPQILRAAGQGLLRRRVQHRTAVVRTAGQHSRGRQPVVRERRRIPAGRHEPCQVLRRARQRTLRRRPYGRPTSLQHPIGPQPLIRRPRLLPAAVHERPHVQRRLVEHRECRGPHGRTVHTGEDLHRGPPVGLLRGLRTGVVIGAQVLVRTQQRGLGRPLHRRTTRHQVTDRQLTELFQGWPVDGVRRHTGPRHLDQQGQGDHCGQRPHQAGEAVTKIGNDGRDGRQDHHNPRDGERHDIRHAIGCHR
jgi:hypothetical protein